MSPPDMNRRRVLQLLGLGTAGGAALASHPWLRALATEPPPGPTVPVPTLPDPSLSPTTTPTATDLAASLDWDVETMFRYVADEIANEPYAGALRGATGTMWGRAGNSIDKAMLLAALLAEAGVAYRFAVGQLDDAATSTPDAEDRDAYARRVAAVLLPPDVADAWSIGEPWQRPSEVDDLLATAGQRLDTTVQLLSRALTEAGVTLPDASAAPDSSTTHVWVQYSDGPDWIDLDPSVGHAEPGIAYATADQTPGELPDDLFHTVTIRLAADVVAAGQPTRAELVSHTVRAVDVVGVPVVIVHPTASWLGIEGAITGDQQYQPSLLIGDELVKGTNVTLTTHEGVLDALGDESDIAEGQTLAEWLEIDVNVPGEPTRQSVRNVFDRIPSVQRESGNIDLTALPNVELTFIDDEVGEVFLPYAGPLVLSIGACMLPSSFFDGEPIEGDPSSVLAMSATAFQSLRDLCRLDFLSDLGVAYYADEPSVLALRATPSTAGNLTDGAFGTTFDILHTRNRFVSLGDAGDRAHPGLIAGALDHAVERLLIDGFGAVVQSPSTSETSVGRVFELAEEAGIPAVTVAPDDRSQLPDLTADARVLVEAALDAGRVVVMPARAVPLNGADRTGWWEIDPATGETLDRMDNAGRTATNEYAFLVRIFTMASCAFAVLRAIAFVAKAAQGKIASFTDAADSIASTGGAIAGCGAGGFAL